MEQIKHSAAISFSTNIWTSQQMEAYITVTAHFIKDDWRLESFVLETKEMGESHCRKHCSKSEQSHGCTWYSRRKVSGCRT